MKKHGYKVIVELDGTGMFTASVPALPGCHTQAKTRKELEKRINDAIALCLETAEQNPAYKRQMQALSYEPILVGLETVFA